MKPGDNCFVDFEDGEEELIGHVEKIERGWARVCCEIDPLTDFGSGTERLSPRQTVCVPVGRIRPRD